MRVYSVSLTDYLRIILERSFMKGSVKLKGGKGICIKSMRRVGTTVKGLWSPSSSRGL